MPDEPTPEQPEMPAAGAFRRLGRLPRAMMVGGLTVGLALGGAGIAFAATSGSSTPSTTTPSKPTSPGPGHPNRGFRGFGPGPGGPLAFGGFGGGRVLHGEYTTTKAGGGYLTVDVQVGQATVVSTDWITVKSADGFTQKYAVIPTTVVDAERDGISSVAPGDQVRVVATVANGTATATNIVDTSKIGASRKGFGFAPRPTPPTTAATRAAI
jgi:hypothetical protein